MGRWVNKHARHNLCFADEEQDADFETGKGTVVSFKDMPLLEKVRKQLPEIIGEKARNLVAEGNQYYDSNFCGIGFHGDGERNLVIAIRLGASMPLHYQWYLRFNRIGKRAEFVLNDGDMYFMSKKAVGKDWKSSSKVTLRHAAGSEKYLE